MPRPDPRRPSRTATIRVVWLELSVQDKQMVNVPVWAGVGAIVAGGVLLLWRKQT